MNTNADRLAQTINTRLVFSGDLAPNVEGDFDIAATEFSAFWQLTRPSGLHLFIALQQFDDGDVELTIEQRNEDGDPIGGADPIYLANPNDEVACALVIAALFTYHADMVATATA